MKFFLIFLLVCVFQNATVFAQAKADTIETVKKGHNYRYYKNGKEMTMKQLSSTLRSDPDATRLLRKSESESFLGIVLAGGFGGVLGYEAGTALAGGKIQPALIAVGVGFLALDIYVGRNSIRAQRRAVELYNDDLHKTSYKTIRPQYYLSFSGNRIGLTMRF